jgi:hypothetical protein
MLRRLLLPTAVAFAIMTPVLAADPPVDPVVAEANQATAQAQAREAQYKAQKAEYDALKARADSLVAPLHQFAGTGTNQVTPSTTQMEATYLAAVAMQDVARIIDQRVSAYIAGPGRNPRARADEAGAVGGDAIADKIEILRNVGTESDDSAIQLPEADAGENPGAPNGDRPPARPPAPPRAQVVLLSGADGYTFDNFVTFEIEASGIIDASLSALRRTGTACPAPGVAATTRGAEFALPAIIAAAGSLIGLLQSDTTVASYGSLGSDTMLINALAGRHNNFYIRQDALLLTTPRRTNRVMMWLEKTRNCEADLKAEIARQSPAQPTDAQKAQVAEMTLVLTHIGEFSTRLRTNGTDGKPLLAAILRQERLQSNTSSHVLRVTLDASGGTLITRKNLWTALGAPAIILSGGVIADYSLSDRDTGALLLGGTVVCRSGMTGLRSAIALQHADIVCADDAPDRQTRNYSSPRRAPTSRRPLDYDNAVFRPVSRENN